MSFKENLSYSAELCEKRLKEILDYRENEPESALWAAMAYSALGNGKRLRAYLTLEFCSLFGESREKALDYACGMEMIHAFSLIHDDLPAMDDDCMRRGKPSCHIAFGEATAILAGDALAIDAFSVVGSNRSCTDSRNLLACTVLSKKAGCRGMTGGQQTDLHFENRKASLEEIIKLIDLKTGALLSSSCMLGCIAAGKEEFLKDAEAFGLYCGRAFQITDDILDITSTSEQMGKTVGKDEKSQKSTVSSLLGIEKARKYASECIENAKKALEKFPQCEQRENLYEFCDYILTRQK